MKINEHIVKLTGKANIPSALNIAENYDVNIEGTITTSTTSDNHDGTYDVIYKLQPIRVQLVTSKGKTIVAKDTRSNSQLLRSLIYKKWINAASEVPFEDFYTDVIHVVMFRINDMIDEAEKRKK